MKITIEDEINNQKLIIERNAINLEEMVAMLEDALRGSGFIFKGHLEIVEDEEYFKTWVKYYAGFNNGK